MKALTLTQPWASLMATMRPDTNRPWKEIETRSCYTGYRGEMVIHAAKGFPKWAKEECAEPEFAVALGGLTADELPRSVGLCVVKLIACLRTENLHKAEFVMGRKPSIEELKFGDYHKGRFAWITQYVRPVREPRVVRGALGLWEWVE